MKTSYIIGPLALFAAFTAYMVPAQIRLEEILTARREAAAEIEAVERAAREEKQNLAIAAQRQHAGERALAQQQRELDRQNIQLARDADQERLLTLARADRENLREEVGALATRHADLRSRRERAAADLFEARRALEGRCIERRSVDLELQRATETLVQRVDASVLGDAPLFPPPRPAQPFHKG